MSKMTIISTAPEQITPLDKGEGSLDLELRSFPPVDDTINFVKNIDWADVRQRARKGFNNCGIVLAVVGEKIHDLGAWMAQA